MLMQMPVQKLPASRRPDAHAHMQHVCSGTQPLCLQVSSLRPSRIGMQASTSRLCHAARSVESTCRADVRQAALVPQPQQSTARRLLPPGGYLTVVGY
eukprot:62283-Pleurochrysis_carterae.AAC.1